MTLGLPALAVAQAGASSEDPVTDFIQVANQTMAKLNFLGCSVRRSSYHHGRLIEALC